MANNAAQKRKKKANRFWDWSNHIFLKLILGLMTMASLSEICKALAGEDGSPQTIAVCVIFGIPAIIIGIATICYGAFVLIACLYGCFVVIPNSDKAKDILEAEAKARKKEDEMLNKYGPIDLDD